MILLVLDSLSTIILLESGCGVESNPKTVWFHKKFGVICGQLLNAITVDALLYSLIAVFFGLMYATAYRSHRKVLRVLSWGVLIAFGYVVAGNLWILSRCSAGLN
jgi:hypothetical protein